MQTDTTRGANDLEAGGSHACRGPWTPDTLAKDRGPGLLLNCLQCSFMLVFPRVGGGTWTAWAPNLWNLIHVYEPWAGLHWTENVQGGFQTQGLLSTEIWFQM